MVEEEEEEVEAEQMPFPDAHCPHKNRKHFENTGMCKNCIFKSIMKMKQQITNCPHKDRPHYFLGFCKECYMDNQNEGQGEKIK